jgi:hypothetical protein
MTSNLIIAPAGPASEYQKTSTDVTEQHLFFVGVNGQLIHSLYDGINTEYVWTSEALTQVEVSPGSDPIAMQLPATGAASTNELHVFFRGVDGSLQHIWWDGSSWFPETISSVAIAVPPLGMLGGSSGRALGGLVYRYETEPATDITELDVFFCGTDGQLHERRFVSNQGWSNPPPLPGPIAGPPTAQFWINPAGGGDVFAGTGDWQVNVFYTGTDGNLHQTYSNEMPYGSGTCTREEQDGWTPEATPGPLAAQAQPAA